MKNALFRLSPDPATVLAFLITVSACAAGNRITYLKDNNIRADLSLPSDREIAHRDTVRRAVHKDTLVVHDFDGREVIIMNAIKDEGGEMVAHDVLEAAVVTARFRNVAERHGKVDLQFNITVPASMRSSRWQLRFHPDLFVMEDSLRLEPVIITGDEYRRAQLRGYQQYDRFLASIISDTTRFVNLWQLEIFLQRNIPEVYALKSDSTLVSDEQFRSIFGVTEQQAVDHYTNKFAKSVNALKKSRTAQMYHRFVKVPIMTEGVRLDTVILNPNGDFTYCYTQTINTRPKLRKVDVVLSGEIYESDQRIYTVPRSEPLTFYISSISAFVDPAERYMTRVVERRVEANTACYIDFGQGSYDVDEGLGNNPEEIGRIKRNLRALVQNEEFDLDSIIISAYASPEGSVQANDLLCLRRARSASAYFSSYVRSVRDSLSSIEGFSIDVSEDGAETVSSKEDSGNGIRFFSRSGGENWPMLDYLISSDEVLSVEQKAEYTSLRNGIDNPDEREHTMFRRGSYRYLREHIYPRLRIVRFDFYLHRKGMVKDTVHTTVLDGNYMAGVQAIRDRDYETAISILRPYHDFNAAVAFTAMDYNASAMEILEGLPSSGEVEYLKAIIHSRQGETEKAVQCFLNAASMDRSYMNRGNLDPEIRDLIRTYNLDRREDEEEFDFSH